MKISKVNHTRAAVNKTQIKTQNVTGVLYQDPSNRNENMEERVKRLGKKARSLYNIFSPVSVGQEPKKPKEDATDTVLKNYATKKANYDRRKAADGCIRNVNSALGSILYERKDYDGKLKIIGIKEPSDVLAKVKKCRQEILGQDSGISAAELVTLYLRKSLKPEAAGAIALIENAGRQDITKAAETDITNFVLFLKKDYNKKCSDEFVNNTIRSIHNQNMTVQPASGQFTMPVPPTTDKKDKTKYVKVDVKTGANAFLLNFANLDEDVRTEQLRKVRRIVDLYFAVPYGYKSGDAITLPVEVDCTAFNIWDKHEDGKKKEGTFVNISEKMQTILDPNIRADSVEKTTEIAELKKLIRERNMNCYRGAKAVVMSGASGIFFDDANINMFWIDHIEDAVEKLLANRVAESPHKLNTAYLSEKVWEDALNYISTKYVALGKAVYHFGMEDINGAQGDINLGKISDSLDGDITSVDYEMIKARESLQRETVAQVAFAANNLARTITDYKDDDDEESDFLSLAEENFHKAVDGTDANAMLRNILQYFGGISKWDKELIRKAYPDRADYHVAFVDDLRHIIYSARNGNFHFRTNIDTTGDWNTKLIGDMFAHEMESCVGAERIRFYSNNLPRYYKVDDLKKVMDTLYARYTDRAAQVPSYEKVLIRKHFRDYLHHDLGMNVTFEAEDSRKWESAVYFICKQVYYNKFLPSSNVKNLFFDAVSRLTVRDNVKDKNKEERAIKNFKERCEEIRRLSLPEICQAIMTEYNLQNAGQMKVRTSYDSLFEKPIFQHYEMLLKQALSMAFAEYMKQNKVYKFLWTPAKQPEIKEEDFLPGWKSGMFDDMILRVKKDAELQKWYVVCHFLNNTALNQMVGSMRSYKQYVSDIKRRAAENNFKLHVDESGTLGMVDGIIRVIDICIKSSAGNSKMFTDYFEDADAYAQYMSRYVDFNLTGSESISDVAALSDFCNNRDEKFDIYMDGQNPILNANVISAKLYGPANIISKVYKKVTEEDIRKYYAARAELTNYLEKGNCKNEGEQAKLIEMQRLKNHVELRDVVSYSELTNELLTQLINWSVIRERDLMYFQLGFHYNCLNNDAAFKPAEYKSITKADGHVINGAILYQIAGMYINGIGVYTIDDKEPNELKLRYTNAGGAGSKIMKGIVPYTKKLLPEFKGNGINNAGVGIIYDAGLELFEKLGEHECIIDVRNYIDHFKYYSENKYSILDLYSEVFDRFFTYDMKYRKNVPNVLTNVLEKQCFIVAEPRFGTGEKVVVKQSKKRDEVRKSRAQIEMKSMYADKFTYKNTGSSETFTLDAKSSDFIETVAKILYYPANRSDGCKIRSIEAVKADESVKNDKTINKESNGKTSNDKKGGRDKEKNTKPDQNGEGTESAGLSYSPFANIKLR